VELNTVISKNSRTGGMPRLRAKIAPRLKIITSM